MNQVAIIMYHYVRPIKSSEYPKIHGLELSLFKGQLNFFQKHFTIITMETLISTKLEGGALPKNALLLTFDDGYLDHYSYVFPELQRRGLQGSFFPPGATVFDKKVLDVNKIHYLIASVPSTAELLKRLYVYLDTYRKEFKLLSNSEYHRIVDTGSRYDNPDVMFIKRMLQKYLPQPVRGYILDSLFTEYVSTSEGQFSKDLYMNLDQLQEMKESGMFIGGHGHAHDFIHRMNDIQQDREIESSLKMLQAVGEDINRWVMCYPYGAYDDAFISKLKSNRCVLGLTSKVGIANLDTDSILELPRFDTNDFPTDERALANQGASRPT